MTNKLTIKSGLLIALVTGYFTLILNWAFFSRIYTYLFSLDDVHPLFALAVPVFVYSFLFMLFSLLVIRGLTKALLIPLVIISAAVSYVSIQFGTIIDYGMIENVVETDAAEARTYFNLSSIAYVVSLGLIPAWALFKINIQYDSLRREVLTRMAMFCAALVVFVGVTLGFYQDFASVGRNNQHVHKYIVPNQLLYSAVKYVNRAFFRSPLEFQELGDDSQFVAAAKKPELIVVVLGETARAMNYHINGYARQTNPYTEKMGFVSLGAVESCGTATALSVPCMFSFLNRSDYDRARALGQSNVLDVIAKSGVDVRWIDNNSGCKGVCERVNYIKMDTSRDNPGCDGEFCFDEVLLGELDRLMASPLQRDTLVVFHLIGSHGPTYYRRYPEAHRRFRPDCQRSDIQNCSHEQIVNSYDNSILYTDYFLSQVAQRLQKHADSLESGLLYMSDHGESLGESGLYLHGMPWQLAPEEQKTVPGMLWLSGDYGRDHHLSRGCLDELKTRDGVSQDFFAYSLLGMMDVKTGLYRPDRDMLSSCRHPGAESDQKLAQKPVLSTTG